MSNIEQELAALGQSRITPAVLNALDFVVPGEWTNATSLDQVIEANLGVTDPAQKALIKAKALALYQGQPHYARAVKVFKAADTFDKVAAAAVMANQAGKAFSFLGVLDRFTPKPETTQAVDAALKLTAEVVAFALLRGIPVTSLTEAKAFPATLATYARADLMRLAAWMTLDGLLPLGPEFVAKIRSIVAGIDTSVLTNNALYQQIADLLPGSNAEEQKGFILSSLDSGSNYIKEFVTARGITQEQLASHVGSLVGKAEVGMDLLAATVDGTTNYFEHTGIQSVARVLVHDAHAELEGVVPPPLPESEDVDFVDDEVETDDSSAWYKTAAAVAAGAGAVAVGAAAYKVATAGSDEEDDDDSDLADVVEDPDEDLSDLEDLDDNAFAAREQALRMRMRRLRRREAAVSEREELLAERRRMRRARLRRRRRGGRRGMGHRQRGGGRGGRGGGRGGRGGGRRA